MNSKLSTIIDWIVDRGFEVGIDGSVGYDTDDIHRVALKHLEALLKEEYRKGYYEGLTSSSEARTKAVESHTNICNRCGTRFADYHICGTGRNL